MYQKVEPVSIAEMNRKRYAHHNTICANIRKAYSKTDDEEIQMLLRIALAMAKKMHNKLKWYKAQQSTIEEKCGN